MRYTIVFLILLLCFEVQSQTDSTDSDDNEEPIWLKGDMNETHEFGIKLGCALSTMLGGEMDNPRPTFGLGGAVYYRYKYKPKAAIQAEVGVSSRGSSFANSAGQYSAIKTYYVDVPVLWVKSLSKSNKTHLLLGLQYSALLNASLYLKPNKTAESERPKLKSYDVLTVAGVQFYSGFVGFQIMAKYGLIDINDGLVANLNPPLKNKNINNLSLEFSFLF